jgi:hypothetical protein
MYYISAIYFLISNIISNNLYSKYNSNLQYMINKVYAFPNTDFKHIIYNCGLEEIQKFNLQYN